VKLPDVNLLLYAYDSESPRQAAAGKWLEDALSGRETVALAWAAMVGFVRVATNPSAFVRPWAAADALDLLDEWVAQPSATVVHPTDRHAAVLRDLLTPLGTAGNLTSDAHLAALAIEHGATLCSCDNDFSRFPGLRWEDPLGHR
jgi:toxin-antitoxin system PIN domain toxin